MAKQPQNNKPLRVARYSHAQIPLIYGNFDVTVYHNNQDSTESLVISKGLANEEDTCFVRVHSECFTGEVIGSLKCDCKYQLDYALQAIAERGRGLVIYLRQEGRGIGLGNKIKAYHLQNQGLDTIQANHALGLPNDLRDFTIAALILKDLGIDTIELNTNNPEKIKTLQKEGFEITKIIPSLSPINPHNVNYLQTKHRHLGHRLGAIFTPSGESVNRQ